MCNKICAYFPLSSSSSERSAAGRRTGRAGSPAGAPRGVGPQDRAAVAVGNRHPTALRGAGASQMQTSSAPARRQQQPLP